MTELVKDNAINAVELLTHYSFELSGYKAEQLVEHWLRDHPASWIRAAVIEALYQGRYKAISVEQLLTFWQRRGQPVYHFNHEFERFVCGRLPKDLLAEPEEPEASWDSNIDFVEKPDIVENTHSPQTVVADSSTASLSTATVESGHLLDNPIQAEPEALEPAMAEPITPAQPNEQPMLDLPAESPIQTFKSEASPAVKTEHMSWAKGLEGKHPIDQFVPATEASDFYVKLRAVAKGDRLSGIGTTFAYATDISRQELQE